ncbi:MAG: hypothetical protein OXH52_22190 [Gammaproteobacteria bacterium]|nr:hypothetical protein [Gammaproteobacteria bacterium]
MIERYFDLVQRTSVLLALFAATLVLTFLVFPALPVGGELLDLKPGGYGHAEAMAALEGYGERGRTVYAWSSVLLDTLFPAVYASMFAGVFLRFAPIDALKAAAWVPLALGVVDLGENAQITAMLVQYPDVSPSQVASASAFTVVKSFASNVCLVYGIAVLALAGGRRLFRRSA